MTFIKNVQPHLNRRYADYECFSQLWLLKCDNLNSRPSHCIWLGSVGQPSTRPDLKGPNHDDGFMTSICSGYRTRRQLSLRMETNRRPSDTVSGLILMGIVKKCEVKYVLFTRLNCFWKLFISCFLISKRHLLYKMPHIFSFKQMSLKSE